MCEIRLIKGNKEVVEFLINNRASVDITNKKGKTPLDIARERGKHIIDI